MESIPYQEHDECGTSPPKCYCRCGGRSGRWQPSIVNVNTTIDIGTNYLSAAFAKCRAALFFWMRAVVSSYLLGKRNRMSAKLSRGLGMPGLVAAGVSSMVGASIYIVPFMVQKNIPGIGGLVLPAFVLASVPALLAALAYAALSSAMPRAGGSYVFVSRTLHPFWGFIASFSQWFGLSVVIGVVAYLSIPFLGTVLRLAGQSAAADILSSGTPRLVASLVLLWLFVGMNLLGLRTLQAGMVAMVALTFALASIVLVAGLVYTQADFLAAVVNTAASGTDAPLPAPAGLPEFLQAAALLFASYIGFDAIAQAGGEARDPARSLPRATLLTFGLVAVFYWLFTAAVYRIIPWTYMYRASLAGDVSAPSLLAYVISPVWTALLSLGAALALVKDLPAMLLSVSRLVFAWARDELFPMALQRVDRRTGSPNAAILFSAGISTLGILGSHYAGDIFLGIDIMVVSMQFNFLLICVALLRIGRRPALAAAVTVLRHPRQRALVGIAGALSLAAFMAFGISKDLSTAGQPWYFHPTLAWTAVMSTAGLLFAVAWRRLQSRPPQQRPDFTRLPEE